jgi:hypothetical protein
MQDDYVSQRYLWRSAPEGIDPVSLIAGNPFHPLWGWIVQRIYDAASINAVESTAWMGPVAAIVLIVTRRDWLVRPGARLWVTVAAAFGIWALGPYLRVFGRHTGLYLPEVLLRYVPIVANARIPGRAIVMVYLAVAMLLAIAVASSWLGKRKAVVAALGVFVLADFQPALPLFRVTIPPVHAELSSMPAGGVIDVPLGIRDGFGERGRLDHRTLYYQSAHGRPIVGGFVARMPGSVRQMFEEAPTLDVLLRLSEGEELDADYVEATRGQVVPFRADRGIRYLVFNHERASPMLREFIRSLPLIPLRSEGEWQLYEVADQ